MPPPRLTRPLRPWHPPSTSARARWLSHGPRDQSTPRRGDGALGGGEPGQPATEVKPDADTDKSPPPQDAPGAGWLRGLVSRASKLAAKPSPSSLPPAPPSSLPPVPSNSSPPPASSEDRPRAHASSEHDASPPSAPSEPPSGVSCLVCHETFATSAKLRKHILKENHVESWSAAFGTREEAAEGVAKVSRYLQFRKDLVPDGWEAALGMTHKRGKEHVCITCQTPVPTTEARVQHWLSNEACRNERGNAPSLFACWRCCKTFTSYTEVGQHVQSSPDCLGYVKARYAPRLLPKAQHRYRQSIAVLLAASSNLETFSNRSVSSLAHGVYQNLHPLYIQAHETRDNDLLTLFHTHSRVATAMRNLAFPEVEKHKLQGREDVSRRDAVSKNKTGNAPRKSLRTLSRPQDGDPLSATSKSHSLAAKAEKPAPNEGPSPSGGDRPAISSTNPDANIEELRLQVQHLTDQVKFLNNKIARQAISHAEVPSAKPSVTSATTHATEKRKDHASVSRYVHKSQETLSNERMKKILDDNSSTRQTVSTPPFNPLLDVDMATETSTGGRRRVHQTPTQARLLGSLDSPDPSNVNARLTSSVDSPPAQTLLTPPPTQTPLKKGEMGEQSLLDELFPEASNYIQPHYGKRNPYKKLDLPSSTALWRPYVHEEQLSSRDKYIQAFQRSMEKLTVLQLLHCSTELTEADFRRLVPKGQHMEGWTRDGDFHQIIPGRDPLSLERLPFYYLVFKNTEAALMYQRNASRLHRLRWLHGPSSSSSAIPPPPGLLENGEDLNAALSAYLLTPLGQGLRLNFLVQPYHPALARLITDGGYAPIVPSTTPPGKPIHKVLFYIEGYEPTPYDLYQVFMQDALSRGLTWPFLHDHQSIHRLRDIVDLKARFQALSVANPRASSMVKRKLADIQSHDPYASFLSHDEGEDGEGQDAQAMSQVIMNRVYNRWVVEFSEEAGARRFARLWHRKVLPMGLSVHNRTWRDVEEVRMCNAEYLW